MLLLFWAIGTLNNLNHTSNDINDLKQWAGNVYTGEKKYIMKPAASDKNLITVNGTAPLDFAKEVMFTLKIAQKEKVVEWYNFHKLGCYDAAMSKL